MRLVWRGMPGRGRRRLLFSKDFRAIRTGSSAGELQEARTKVCATVFRTLLFLGKCGRVVVTSKWCLRQGARPA